MKNVYFDTCVYHQPGSTLTKVIPVDNILFASEMIGAVRGTDPQTGHYYDDTRRYIEATGSLSSEDRHKVYGQQRAAGLSTSRQGADGQRPIGAIVQAHNRGLAGR